MNRTALLLRNARRVQIRPTGGAHDGCSPSKELTMTTEYVPFRIIVMPCCGHQLCWVNPRLPTYCPECGKIVYPEVRSCVINKDERALLQFNFD